VGQSISGGEDFLGRCGVAVGLMCGMVGAGVRG
jgi:hypothetical protein